MTANPADEPRADDDPEGGTKPSASAWSAWSHDELLVIVERQAAEVERLTKLAEANGGQARFWADHFAEIERANRDALGAHHKSGHGVAELITAVVQELAEAREFGNDAMDSASAKAQEIAKWVEGYGKLSADNKRLTRERDEAQALADTRLSGLQDALAVNTDFQKVGRKRLGLPWHYPSDLDAALEAVQAQLASRPAIPAGIAGFVNGLVNGLHGHGWTDEEIMRLFEDRLPSSAPSVGSDTTAEAAELPLPMWRSACLDRNPNGSQECHLAKGHEGPHEGGHSMLGLAEWQSVSPGGDTDTTEVPGER